MDRFLRRIASWVARLWLALKSRPAHRGTEKTTDLLWGEFDEYDLALTGPPDEMGYESNPWFTDVLEAIKADAEKALSDDGGTRHNRMMWVFWDHTENTLRVFGTNVEGIENTYAFRLKSHPIFEVIMTVDDDLNLIDAYCGSDAPGVENMWIDAMPFVVKLYDHYLVELIRRLRKIEGRM